MSTPVSKWELAAQKLARSLKLYERDPAPRWFRLLLLIIAILLLVLTPLVVLLGGDFRLSHAGSLCMALSFLLILGADGLKAANSAALARLARITLMVFGALLFVGSFIGGWLL